MRLAILLIALVAAGCSAAPRALGDASRPFEARSLAGVAPRYLPGFGALQAALDEHEDETARQILRRLEARIQTDRLAETRASEGDSDPGPSAYATQNALDLCAGFRRILGGRDRVGDLTLALDCAPSGAHRVQLVLRAGTRGGTPVSLEPGPAALRVHHVAVTPSGRETHNVREQPVAGLQAIWIDPEGVTEIPIGIFPLAVPSGAIALRAHWSLVLRSGAIIEGDASFPAMRVPVTPAERSILTPVFPTAPVEPAELASYVQRSDVTLPPIMERAVRISPERREEALDLLAPVVERSTPEELERIVPAIRWLARTTGPGSDPLAWKLWMRGRNEDRERVSRPALDIPGR